jgi:hypothetical protein
MNYAVDPREAISVQPKPKPKQIQAIPLPVPGFPSIFSRKILYYAAHEVSHVLEVSQFLNIVAKLGRYLLIGYNDKI